MKTKVWKSEYFYGNKISEEGIKRGWVDYGTLGKTIPHILNNDIISKTSDIGYWDIVNGSEYYNDADEYIDIYQYYIIPSYGAEILEELTDEIVFYNEELDMYVWGITHWGTSWDYVLTNIKLELEED